MKYLMLDADGDTVQTDAEPSQEQLEKIDHMEMLMFRFTTGGFEQASVHAVDDTRSLSWGPVEERS